MAFLEDHKAKFENLRISLELQNRNQLRREANGGNSIIFSYPPEEEKLYIEKAKELFDETSFRFIDISKLLVKFINEDGWDSFAEYYRNLSDTPYLIFMSDDESVDLMDMILQEIMKADLEGASPVLCRTGALYGTGIENVNITGHKAVMNLQHPLVIFYPAKLDNNNLYFLNFKPASRYRCTVIE